MCVFMASGGIGFFSSVSVYNGFGLRNKLRDGPLHNEKARGIFFSPHGPTIAIPSYNNIQVSANSEPRKPVTAMHW